MWTSCLCHSATVFWMAALGFGKRGSDIAVMPNKHATSLPPLSKFNRCAASSDHANVGNVLETNLFSGEGGRYANISMPSKIII